MTSVVLGMIPKCHRVVVAALVLAAVSSRACGGEEAHVKAMGETFKHNCRGCHFPPDLQFSSDQAWVKQILKTA